MLCGCAVIRLTFLRLKTDIRCVIDTNIYRGGLVKSSGVIKTHLTKKVKNRLKFIIHKNLKAMKKS